jgi:outer membrane protein assembly factor BamB
MKRRAALLACWSAVALGAEWPHFLGPQHNGASTESGLLHVWAKEGPRKLWEHAKGEGHSAPTVSGGRVVVFYAEGEKEVVEALDVVSGKVAWRFAYDAPFTPKYGGASGPCSNPTIAAGRVFTLGISSILHCLDLATGRIVWRRDLARDYQLLPTFFGQGGTPLAVGERVFVSLGTEDRKSVVALDSATGKEVWAAKHAWGSSYSSPVPATIHGRECVLAFQGGMGEPPTGGLLVIDATKGAVLCATPHRAKMFASVNVSAPVAIGARVFVAEAYTEGGLCVEIAPDFSARPTWTAANFDTYLTTAVPHEGHLYGWAGMHQQNAALACYEIATGREMWRDALGGKYQRASLLRVDGTFLCLGENGGLAWLNLSPKGATVEVQAKLFHAPETWTPPVVSDGRLFICQNQPGGGGTKPRVICYDLRAP